MINIFLWGTGAVSYTHLDVYKRQDLILVLFRTDLSILSTILIQHQRIHQQPSHVSVIQIWLMRWYSTARIIFFHRLDSQCLLRLISRHREFFHFSVNNYYYYYKQKSRCLHRLFLSKEKEVC